MDNDTTDGGGVNQRPQVVARQPRVCPKSRLSPERSRKYVRSGMTPRANDLCVKPIQRNSSHQHLTPGRKSGVRGRRLSSGSSKQGRHSSNSLTSPQDAMQNKSSFSDLLPGSPNPSNRRWRSSDKIDLAISDRTHKLEDPIGEDGDRMTEMRSRLYSEPSSVFLAGRKRFNETWIPPIRDSGMEYSQDEGQSLTQLDTVQTAQLLVQSDEDLRSNTNVLQPPDSSLPMSVQGHPFILPLEEVPVPLTPTLLNTFVSPDSTRSSLTHSDENHLNNGNTLVTSVSTTATTVVEAVNCSTLQQPGTVKSAWQDIQTITVSPTEEKSAFTYSQRRRHSGNIDFRAAVSHFNRKPHPLPKSKSSWRLQAAKARESVANLLSFAKTPKQKEKYDPGQRVGLHDKKVSLQYNSSPCLSESDSLIPNHDTLSFNEGGDQSICQIKHRDGQLSRLLGMHWSNPELMSSEFKGKSDIRSEGNNDLSLKYIDSFSSEITPRDQDHLTQRQQVDEYVYLTKPGSTECSSAFVDEQEDVNDIDSEVFEIPAQSKTDDESEMSQETVSDPLDESHQNLISPNKFSNNHTNTQNLSTSDTNPYDEENKLLSGDNLPKSENNMTTVEETNDRNHRPEILTESQSKAHAITEETNAGQSDINEEHEYKKCPRLSQNLQQTLSSVRKHLAAREKNESWGKEEHKEEIDASVLVEKEEVEVKKMDVSFSEENVGNPDDSVSSGKSSVSSSETLQPFEGESYSVLNLDSLGDNNYDSDTIPDHTNSDASIVDVKPTDHETSVESKNNESKKFMISTDTHQNKNSSSNSRAHHANDVSNILTRAKIHNRPESRNSSHTKSDTAIPEGKERQREHEIAVLSENNSIINKDGVSETERVTGEIPFSSFKSTDSRTIFTTTITSIKDDADSAGRRSDTPINSSQVENSANPLQLPSSEENFNANLNDSLRRINVKTPISLTTMKQYWENIDGNANVLPKLERSDSVSSLNSEMSITSTRSEARGKRESSRRVQDMLSNKLFQKHLAKHTENLEKRVFCMHKKGIRKTLSNFDLSTSQSAEMGNVINTLLNGGDINNNSDGVDNSDDDSSTSDINSRSVISRSVSMLNRCLSPSPISGALANVENNAETSLHIQAKRRPFMKAATAINLHSNLSPNESKPEKLVGEEDSRRNSLSCDELSFQRLKQTNSGEDKDSPGISNLNQRHRRLYIPSFKEFKRQKSATDITQVSESSPSIVENAGVHTHSDIYVIEEDDNDNATKKEEDGVGKAIDENLDKNKINSDISMEDSHCEKKNSRSKRKNAVRSNTSSSKNPVFSHPAIVITSADVADAAITSPRHRLNRSKSESNMKKYRSLVQKTGSAVQRPQTPDITNFFTSISVQVPALTATPASFVNDTQASVTKMVKSESFHWDKSDKEISSEFHERLSERLKFHDPDNTQSVKHQILTDTEGFQNSIGNIENSGSDLNTRAVTRHRAMQNKENRMKGRERSHWEKILKNNDDDRLSRAKKDHSENSEDSDNEPLGFSASNLFLNRSSTPGTNENDNRFPNDMTSRSAHVSNTAVVKSDNTNAGHNALSPRSEYLGGTQEFLPGSEPCFLESLGFTSHTDVFPPSTQIKHDSKKEAHSTSLRSLDSKRSSSASTETLVEKAEESYGKTKYLTGHSVDQVDIFKKDTGDLEKDEKKERDDILLKKLVLTDCVRNDVTAQTDDVNKVDVSLLRRSPTSSASDSDQSSKTSVLRSTSDVSAVALDERERRRRDRKDRPYKSDPFTGTNNLPHHSLTPDTGLYKVPSVSTSCSFPSLEELAEYSDSASLYEEEDEEIRKRRHRLSNISTASEDSGLAGHTTHKLTCTQCDSYTSDSTRRTGDSIAHTVLENALVCKKCAMRVRERKETIQEIAETEKRYGRDLTVLKEEFYRPMKATNLLSLDQLDTIFINLEELVHVHKLFMAKLTSALVSSVKEGDEEFAKVNIGSVFLESSTMFLAFENYCVNQAKSSALLEQLEKDKELLRVFLQVAQNENPKLRRMHLKSFLMVPVQRVMKYPLLLSRLHKVTPSYHGDKENIKQAQETIEDILEHINAKTHVHSGVKRRSLDLHGYSLSDKIEVNRVAIELLGWTKKDVCDVITSRLWYGQVPDPSWASKRARNVKFNMVHAVLLTNGRPVESPVNLSSSPVEPSPVIQVAMVLVREKGGRYQVVRDPLFMDRCVVTVDPEYNHVFEIHEQSKDTYLFKAEHSKETSMWIRHLRQLSRNLGYWRRRRNGLPNIMLKTS